MNEVEKALQERFLLQEEYLGDEKPVNGITPLVSVTVATYQQVSYIKECLDGILMQQTTFPYEIILGEDGSIDGTQEICKEYAERYPDKIRLFIRDRKLSQYEKDDGSITRFNGLWNRMSVRGRYIAWCEGDDYWIDPLKLQKQVDFLESHLDYSMCFHNAIVYKEEIPNVSLFNLMKSDEDLTIHNAIHKWLVPTASIVVRSDAISNYPQWMPRIYSGDYSLILLALYCGKIRYLHSISSVYRSYSTGSMSVLMKGRGVFIIEQHLFLLKAYNKGTNYIFKEEVDSRIKELEKELLFQKAKKSKNIYSLLLSADLIVKKGLNRLGLKG